ncbi:RidA family protein [Vibrio alfacsensis]|uniref:RidA family protein n=1 Tax=Vibrio TaxID=662 RepID=UPI0040677618
MNSVIRKHTNDRMSKIVTHQNTVYLCGQVGNRGDSIEEQTREAMTRVDALLEEAGSDRNHILQAVVWLSDMQDFAAMNAVWDGWFEPGFAPARACGEAKLASPELKFEVIVTAALKEA